MTMETPIFGPFLAVKAEPHPLLATEEVAPAVALGMDCRRISIRSDYRYEESIHYLQIISSHLKSWLFST